jgi:hypothetical protein
LGIDKALDGELDSSNSEMDFVVNIPAIFQKAEP